MKSEDQTAVSVKEIESRVLRLCDLEKRRIGQDLHDSTGQLLTGISLMSKALSHRLEDMGLKEASAANRLAELVDEMIRQIRNVIAGLAPAEIQDQSASDALCQLCSKVEKIHEIRCEFRDESACEINDPEVVKNLYFIAQESVNNALRHGEADQITVTLLCSGSEGMLCIVNNGECRVEDFHSETGLGVNTMRCRAQALDGELKIERVSEDNLSVICRFRIPVLEE